jgi:hypothetical protein
MTDFAQSAKNKQTNEMLQTIFNTRHFPMFKFIYRVSQ